MTAILLQVALLLGPMLFLASRFALPRGAYALLTALALLPPLVLENTYRLAPAVIVGALLTDALAAVVCPHASIARLRMFAFAASVAIVGAYFATLRAKVPIEWTVHLWAGAIVLAGGVGLLLALLIGPPSPQAMAPTGPAPSAP